MRCLYTRLILHTLLTSETASKALALSCKEHISWARKRASMAWPHSTSVAPRSQAPRKAQVTVYPSEGCLSIQETLQNQRSKIYLLSHPIWKLPTLHQKLQGLQGQDLHQKIDSALFSVSLRSPSLTALSQVTPPQWQHPFEAEIFGLSSSGVVDVLRQATCWFHGAPRRSRTLQFSLKDNAWVTWVWFSDPNLANLPVLRPALLEPSMTACLPSTFLC